jgi:hypothetical protein
MITQPFLEQMKRQGMRIREYRLAPGERVVCTICADDDAVVGRMRVPLAGVKRVDALQSLDLGDGRVQQWRLEDVPFDPDAGEVLTLPSAAELKKLPAHMSHVRLVAVDESGERSLGEYIVRAYAKLSTAHRRSDVHGRSARADVRSKK